MENAVDIRIFKRIAKQDKKIQENLEENSLTGQEEAEDKTQKLDPPRKAIHLKVFDEDHRNNPNRKYIKSPPNL